MSESAGFEIDPNRIYSFKELIAGLRRIGIKVHRESLSDWMRGYRKRFRKKDGKDGKHHFTYFAGQLKACALMKTVKGSDLIDFMERNSTAIRGDAQLRVVA